MLRQEKKNDFKFQPNVQEQPGTFLTKKKIPQHYKRLIWGWKYVGGINCVINKKKRKKVLIFFFF